MTVRTRRTLAVGLATLGLGALVGSYVVLLARQPEKVAASACPGRRVDITLQTAVSLEQRLHEELGDLPPAEYEHLNYRRGNTPILATTSTSF